MPNIVRIYQMMEDIRAKDNIRYVLVFKLSVCQKHQRHREISSGFGLRIGLLGVKDGIDTSTVTGKMIANIMGPLQRLF